jgi:regulator of replication initiation timing
MIEKTWYYIKHIFKTKENKNMPETTKAVSSLKNDVAKQKTELNNLRSRISQLADNNHLLSNELDKLKKTVAEDIKFLYERMTKTS